ncbi:MAG: hypothetical protein K6F93_04650, partial [Lachnospiraceae bacterium]|nr:hypothetical protein [Lachnospiraceae bacterium]
MILKYYVLDPTGNITILAEGNVPAEERGAVAAKLMEKEPAAEQVGFISYGQARVDRTDAGHAAGEENRGAGHADITLQMAGGEFCGNATMSAAVLAVHLGKVRDESAANREEKGTCANREEKGICADGENSYNVNVLASGAEGIRRVHVEAKEDGSYMGTVDMPEPIS